MQYDFKHRHRHLFCSDLNVSNVFSTFTASVSFEVSLPTLAITKLDIGSVKGDVPMCLPSHYQALVSLDVRTRALFTQTPVTFEVVAMTQLSDVSVTWRVLLVDVTGATADVVVYESNTTMISCMSGSQCLNTSLVSTCNLDP